MPSKISHTAVPALRDRHANPTCRIALNSNIHATNTVTATPPISGMAIASTPATTISRLKTIDHVADFRTPDVNTFTIEQLLYCDLRSPCVQFAVLAGLLLRDVGLRLTPRESVGRPR